MVKPRQMPALRYKNCKALEERGRKVAPCAKRPKALIIWQPTPPCFSNTQQHFPHLPMLRSSAVAPVTILTTPPSWAPSVIRLLRKSRKINLSGKRQHFSPSRLFHRAARQRKSVKSAGLFPNQVALEAAKRPCFSMTKPCSAQELPRPRPAWIMPL